MLPECKDFYVCVESFTPLEQVIKLNFLGQMFYPALCHLDTGKAVQQFTVRAAHKESPDRDYLNLRMTEVAFLFPLLLPSISYNLL